MFEWTDKVLSVAKSAVNSTVSVVNSGVSAAVSATKKVGEKLVRTTKRVADAGVDLAKAAIETCADAASSMYDQATDKIADAMVVVGQGATNFFQKAVTTAGVVSNAVKDTYNSAMDKVSDYLADKMVEAQAILSQFPDALRETHDELTERIADYLAPKIVEGSQVWELFKDELKKEYDQMTDDMADALFETWQEAKKAVEEFMKDSSKGPDDVDEVAREMEKNPEKFAKKTKDKWKETVSKPVSFLLFDDGAFEDAWEEYYKNSMMYKVNSIPDDDLEEFYKEATKDATDYIVKKADEQAEEYKKEYNKSISKPSGVYKKTDQTEDIGKVNESITYQSDINNAIMDAISKYLPPKYRYVDHLQSIPHDIMKEACNQLEYELRNDSSHSLSTTDRERIMNIMWLSSGLGGYYNQLQTFMTSLNRFGGTNVTPSTEHVGLTFITRPRLCLQSSNIRNNRIMTTLDTLNNSTMAFAIRCLLDSNFGNANNGLYRGYVSSSPIFDEQNPFLVPLCNALTSFNGSPDIDIESTTTDGGYMSEAQTFAIGGSNLQRGNYNLTLNFQEVAHNPVLAILYYWIEYIRCVTRGSLMAYADDIDAQRLNYTVSIYRFLLDPTHRYITKYAKYTGCYPTGLPIGSAFNFSQGDVEVNASKNLSITFNCNKVEYMDYAILMDFNTLVKRYCPMINKGVKTTLQTRQVPRRVLVPETRYRYVLNPNTGRFRPVAYTAYVERITYETQQYIQKEDVEFVPADEEGRISSEYSLKCPSLPMEALTNFRGLPYIVSDRNGFRLDFRQHPSPAFNYQTETLADQLLYLDMIGRLSKEMTNYDTVTSLYTPDYYEKANAYKNVDLRAFIRRAFANTGSSDSLSPIQ